MQRQEEARQKIQENRRQRAEKKETERQTRNAGKLDADVIADRIEQRLGKLSPKDRAKLVKRVRETIHNATDLEKATSRKRFVQNLGRMSGVNIKLADLTKKGTVRSAPEGFYQSSTNTLVLDIHTKQGDAIYRVMLHELTHSIEGSGLYGEYANALLALKYGTGPEAQARINADVLAYQERYNRELPKLHEQDSSIDATPLEFEDAQKELVADMTFDVLFKKEGGGKNDVNTAAIKQLTREHEPIAKRIWSALTRFVRKLAGINDPAVTWIEQVQDMFARALEDARANRQATGQRVEGRTQYAITGEDLIEIDDAQREKILRGENIRVVQPNDQGNQLTDEDISSLTDQMKSIAQKNLRDILDRFGAYKPYSNQAISFKFVFSRGRVNESAHYQTLHRHSLLEQAEVYAQLDKIVENAVPIETHKDIYEETVRADDSLERVYIMLSALQKKNGFVVPVELEIKEFKEGKANTLHNVVTINEIKTEGLGGNLEAANAVAENTPTSVSEISIPELVSHVNPSEGFFLKYIPDGMLNGEQLESKRAAIEEENKKIAALKNGSRQYSLPAEELDDDYMAAVEAGEMDEAQGMVDQAAQEAGYTVKGYHGTANEFNVFDRSKSGENWQGDSRYGPGFYFAHDSYDAMQWTDGTRIVDAWLSLNNPLDLRGAAPDNIADAIRERTAAELEEYNPS